MCSVCRPDVCIRRVRAFSCRSDSWLMVTTRSFTRIKGAVARHRGQPRLALLRATTTFHCYSTMCLPPLPLCRGRMVGRLPSRASSWTFAQLPHTPQFFSAPGSEGPGTGTVKTCRCSPAAVHMPRPCCSALHAVLAPCGYATHHIHCARLTRLPAFPARSASL